MGDDNGTIAMALKKAGFCVFGGNDAKRQEGC